LVYWMEGFVRGSAVKLRTQLIQYINFYPPPRSSESHGR
jgi:hypothetical protein